VTESQLNLVEALGRGSRRTAILTALGVAIVLASLGYSSHTLRVLQTRITAKQAELRTCERQLEDKKQELQRYQEQCDAMTATLDTLGMRLALGDTSGAEKVLSVELSGKADRSVKHAVAPRVYFQVRTTQQIKGTEAVRKALTEAGYSVPRPEVIAAIPHRTAEVRYFRKAEEKEARAIQGIVASHGTPNCQLQYVSGYEGSKLIRPRHYELWLGRNG